MRFSQFHAELIERIRAITLGRELYLNTNLIYTSGDDFVGSDIVLSVFDHSLLVSSPHGNGDYNVDLEEVEADILISVLEELEDYQFTEDEQ
jgi:hypothetical protein